MPPLPPPNPNQLDFARPFTYVFDDPRWMQKILIGGLFYIAGFFLIGWFFILGYLARVARNVVAGNPTPLPEWEDLGEFFNDGARLIGVALAYVVPFIAVVLVLIVPSMVMTSAHNEGIQAVGGMMAGCLWCLMVPLSLGVMIFMPASLLFAAIEQRAGAGFDFPRIWAFIRGNIGNYLLAVVVYLIARMLGGFGVFLLCVGVVFTAFWSLLITTHAFAQVYRIATRPKVS